MISIIFYSIWILNILFVLIKKKSKVLTLLSVAVSVWIVYQSTSTADYWIYMKYYQADTSGGIEIGYIFLMRLANMMGLTYNEFLMVISIICFAIIMIVYRQFTDNYQLFFSLYFIYEYAIDITQVRNFVASCLLLLAFYFIVKRKRIFAIVTIAISALMHISMLFYIPLLFINPESYKNRKALKYCSIAIVFMCVALKFGGSRFSALSNLLSTVVGSTDLGDKTSYFYSLSNNGYLLYFALCAVNIAVFMYSRHVIRNNMNQDIVESEMEIILDAGLLINLYCVFSFPFIILNMSFYRLFRNVLLINFMISCIAADSFKKTTTAYYKYILTAFVGNLLYKIPLVHGSSLLTPILEELKGNQ